MLYSSDMNTSNTNKLVVDFEHDDTKKQENLFLRLNNLLNDFAEAPLSVEVVAYGPGIKMLLKENVVSVKEVKQLQGRNIQFRACQNAMRMFEVSEDQLIDGVRPVPSGVGRIVKAQLEGYAYFKG